MRLNLPLSAAEPWATCVTAKGTRTHFASSSDDVPLVLGVTSSSADRGAVGQAEWAAAEDIEVLLCYIARFEAVAITLCSNFGSEDAAAGKAAAKAELRRRMELGEVRFVHVLTWFQQLLRQYMKLNDSRKAVRTNQRCCM